jgi:cytochrome c-type biogenesis protein CcmH
VKSIRTAVAFALTAAALFVGAPALADSPPPATSAPQSVNFDTYVKGAAELEGKIIAPCCWTQTIDIHGSPVSTELRQEIRQRLSAGESSEDIERSLVQRYGPKILAVPAGSRLGSAGGMLVVVMAAAGVGAVVLLRRWQRRSKPLDEKPEKRPEPRPGDAALDARIDAELASLDRD